ncbi:MAG: oligosaccharide flippase family protein [Patescibacteria group bacterium]|nr:oligosaccharide flippase family protein [Patescibacteria group bacterium]
MSTDSKAQLVRFLRWSERYTKTDMVYLASGGFWSTIAQVVESLTIFGLAILVAHFLPKEIYGEYKYIIATVALISSFSLTGLGSAVFQSVASGYDGSLAAGFRATLRWSALAVLGAFALAAYYFLHGNTALGMGMLIGGSLSPLLTAANLGNTFLSAKKDFKRSALYFGLLDTVFVTGALAVTVLIAPNTLALIAVYFAANTLSTFWFYRRVVRLYRPDPTHTDPGMLSYAKHLSLMGILNGIAGNIDQVLLFHFVGPVQLAIYNFAIAIPDQTKGPLKTLDTMLQARFVSRSDTEIRTSMRNKMLWLFISSMIFIGAYIVLAPYFYRIFFPNYIDSIFYSQVYVCAQLGLVFWPASSYLSARKRVREQYIVTVGVAAFQIGVMVIGVLSAGLLGLIIARVISRISGPAFAHGLYRMTDRPGVYNEQQ